MADIGFVLTPFRFDERYLEKFEVAVQGPIVGVVQHAQWGATTSNGTYKDTIV